MKQVTQYSFETVSDFLEPPNSEQSLNDVPNASVSHLQEVQKIIFIMTYDSDTEDNTQENVGNINTLLDDENLENRSCLLTFAPGENQRPLSIY